MGRAEAWTREGVKRRLVKQFYTRFHMSLILASSTLAAMLTSWALLHLGVTAMLARYPLAIAAAYATFLGCVWLWLRHVGIVRDGGTSRSLVDHADLPNIPIGSMGGPGGSGGTGITGGGGSFDGGGASASWAEGASGGGNASARAIVGASAPKGAAAGGLGELGDLGSDEIGLILVAIALIAAIFLASGYLVYMAPDILTEAAFGALLAGGLARGSRREDAGGWVAGVVKKTWWPFAIVLVIAVLFASYAAANFPQAHTFRQALAAALAS
jgi:hypothetical protein